MNRDAKIGIVVVLIIVGLLVVIWGRGERNEAVNDDSGKVLPGSRIDTSMGRAGSTLDEGAGAVSGGVVIPDHRLPGPDLTSAAKGTTTPAGLGHVVKPEPKTWEYTVASGDMLEKVAAAQLGDGKRWPEIAKLNDLKDPYKLKIGQKLKMPPKEKETTSTGTTGTTGTTVGTTTGTTGTGTGTTTATTRKYTVKDTDTLTLIAREQLHDGKLWKKIAEMNKLQEPYRLKVGQVLALPE